jgi:hypothetical protein
LIFLKTSTRDNKKLNNKKANTIICNNPVRGSDFNSHDIKEVAPHANKKLKKLKNVSLPVKYEKNARTATIDSTIRAKSTDKAKVYY